MTVTRRIIGILEVFIALALSSLGPALAATTPAAAWEALAEARKMISQYQSSGHADPRRLEAALREIGTLEGSEYVGTLDELHQRQFGATLSGVYQLIGAVPPAEMNSLFFSSPVSVAISTSPGAALGRVPRFSSGPGWIRWMDEEGDDHGPGTFQYPVGAYPQGSWDIRDAEIRWDDSVVKMTFHLTSLENPWGAPGGFSLPVIDVYVDLNHILGAGCETLLTGRGARMAPEDAWEYALSVTGWGACLYRSASRSEFLRIQTLVVQFAKGRGEISVEIPRSILRGDPMNWGYAIAVSGKGHSRPTDPLDLAPISSQPAPDVFGGAVAGKTPASFLDIMVPPGVSQETVLSAYTSGRDVVLPMLRGK
jgi:hypothetical protein